MTVFYIVLISLGSIGALLLGVGYLAGERARRQDLYTAYDLGDRRSMLTRTTSALERRVLRTEVGRRWRTRLNNADVHTGVGVTVLTALVVTAFVLVIAFQIGGPILTAIMGVMGYLGARFYLQSRAEKRRLKFIDQLPELSRLLANATNAGLSMQASLKVAAQETVEPMRSELQQVNEELAVGTSLDEVLDRMSARLPSRELSVLLNVLIIQTRAGGRIVTALRGITEALESRRDVRREVNTLLAGSKATVLAVAALGGVMVFLVHTSLEGGLRGLLENPVGFGVFAVSMSLFVFGLWLITRFTKVDV